MIQHEITIYEVKYGSRFLSTVSRDLKKHREGDLPAWREWYENGSLSVESYYLNGLYHREVDLPAYRGWYENGSLSVESYYLNGLYHREGGLPAFMRWGEKGVLQIERCYKLSLIT
jgi:hypothetical protein